MLSFIKRLLGRESATAAGSAPTAPPKATTVRESETADTYFATMEQLQAAVSARDYERAARLARENLSQVPAFVRSTRDHFGGFDIHSVPALQVGGTMMALVGDDRGLAEMRQIVTSTADLEPWLDAVEQHAEDRRLFTSLLDTVKANPGCLQTDLKQLIGHADGRRVSNLVAWLEKAGRIVRERQGRSYAVWVADAAGAPVAPAEHQVRSHRTDQRSSPPNEIDLSRIPYVPLPRAPLNWEQARQAGRASEVLESSEPFEVRDAEDWEIAAVEKIPMAERPDPAFRRMYPLDSGLILLDDLGRAEELGNIPAAALWYGRGGEQLWKKPLSQGVYRVEANPLGHGLIALSKDCVLHAYGDALEPLLETSLLEAPEIRAMRNRFEIGNDQLKNHIRCVALSTDQQRYLFTTVDEAWCVDVSGRALWGVRLPLKEGWTRISERAETVGTVAEIERSLSLMQLAFPFTPDDLKKRYRQLAKQWHPDLNPGNPESEQQMKALTGAMELLSGIDAHALPSYTGTRFEKEVSRSEIQVDGEKLSMTMSYVVSEIHAADWIYAATFAGRSNAVFLAGYSGRVIALAPDGSPLRAYDIGVVPRRIVDTGDYLYILTDTRLYVLRGEFLHAVVDVFDGGDLVVAQTGFGLLEKKRFRWFREDGHYLGAVVTKEPIRRVYTTPEGLVVESRQRRATIRGTPGWWEDVQ